MLKRERFKKPSKMVLLKDHLDAWFFYVGTPKESIFFGPLSMAYISVIIAHIFTNYISFMI
jgi:hypothetical protein